MFCAKKEWWFSLAKIMFERKCRNCMSFWFLLNFLVGLYVMTRWGGKKTFFGQWSPLEMIHNQLSIFTFLISILRRSCTASPTIGSGSSSPPSQTFTSSTPSWTETTRAWSASGHQIHCVIIQCKNMKDEFGWFNYLKGSNFEVYSLLNCVIYINILFIHIFCKNIYF